MQQCNILVPKLPHSFLQNKHKWNKKDIGYQPGVYIVFKLNIVCSFDVIEIEVRRRKENGFFIHG